MLKTIGSIAQKLEEKKWIIAALSAGIAVAAAVISVLVYFSKKNEEEVEEDCFAE